ncbi:MAG: hypothetical protein WCZ90_06555 [Melioribacteraceae bacterium]
MPLPFIAKKRIGGWLVVLSEFQNNFHVKVMAPNGKLNPFQFSTQAEATEFFNFFCSKLSAFLRSPKKTKSKEFSLFNK